MIKKKNNKTSARFVLLKITLTLEDCKINHLFNNYYYLLRIYDRANYKYFIEQSCKKILHSFKQYNSNPTITPYYSFDIQIDALESDYAKVRSKFCTIHNLFKQLITPCKIQEVLRRNLQRLLDYPYCVGLASKRAIEEIDLYICEQYYIGI